MKTKNPAISPNPDPALSAHIRKAFFEGTPIDLAVDQAVREAVAEHAARARAAKSKRKLRKSA